MDSRVRDLIKIGDKEFNNRSGVMSLFQDLAENFYVERADFTTKRSDGEEFASGLMTSFPLIARRELGNMIASYLRPRGTDWFAVHAQDEQIDADVSARAWLEYATNVQKRAMYDPASLFVNATKTADHDFATFGNAVKSIEVDWANTSLLYRAWHLRDCAWCENRSGKIDTMHRKWKPTVRQLVSLFPKTVHPNVKKALEKEPEKEVACRHIVVPQDAYDLKTAKSRKLPYVSLYVDEENETVLEEIPLGWFPYIVSRWSVVSGSVYGRSPVTEICLPDARLLQAMTRVLLEAGEKAVDPPSIASEETFRSDFNLFAGGVTFAQLGSDESIGDKFQQLSVDKTGIPMGINMAMQIRDAITGGFFLNKLILPEINNQGMTAYQVSKIIQNYIRQAAPIFEPIEEEDNAPTCNLTFEILRSVGAFGPVDQLPEILQGSEVNFTFISPLREVADEMKGAQLQEAVQGALLTAQVDPSAPANVDWTTAYRDALQGNRIPAKWMNPREAVEQEKARLAEQAKVMAGAQALAGTAGVAKDGTQALKQLSEAMGGRKAA